MLLTDGVACSFSYLASMDSGIGAVCSAEQVDATAKVWMAQERVGSEVEIALRRSGRRLTANHVVISEALRRWIAAEALVQVYADVAGNHTSERYEKKRKEFRLQADEAKRLVLGGGIGVVWDPLPIGGNMETRLIPGSAPSGKYAFYAVRSRADDTEGEPGPTCEVEIGQGCTVVLRVKGEVKEGGYWNVYGAKENGVMTRQNSVSLRMEEEWELPSSGLLAGVRAGCRQSADCYVIDERRLWRG